MKLALYIRVSTAEQNPDLQERELRAWAVAMQHSIEAVYTEVESGAVDARPVRRDMLLDARARKFDAIVVWKLDRFGRSFVDLVSQIQQLDRIGIRFICPRQGIDTDKHSPEGQLLLHLLAAFAEFERNMIRDRTAAGVERYKQDLAAGRVGVTVHSKSGKDLPPHGPRRVFDREAVLAMRRRDPPASYRQIEKQLGISRQTALRVVRDEKKKGTPLVESTICRR